MQRFIFSLFIVSHVALAQPELEIVNLLRDFSNFLQTACEQLGNADDLLANIPLGLDIPEELSWMCATLPSINRAADVADAFLSDVNGFASQTMSDSFGKLGNAFGWEVGGTDLQTIVNDAMGEIEDGVFSAKAMAGKVLAQLHQALYANGNTVPANTTAAEQEMAAFLDSSPSSTMQQFQGLEVREENLLRSASAVDVVNQAKALAATSIARGDEQQLLLRVTNPAHAIPGGAGGTADEAEDLAFASVSSRATLQASVQAQADYMRQAAVSSSNITAALKEQAVQQTLTTQQLGTLIESISEQNLREYEKWEAEYFDDIVKATAKGQEIEDNFAAIAHMISDNAGVEP